MKIHATVTNKEGEYLPGAIFLRGASVGMLVLLQPDDLPRDSQKEKHVLLTVQPRIAAGGLQFVELPAGMVDKGTFGGTAAREIEEELGLEDSCRRVNQPERVGDSGEGRGEGGNLSESDVSQCWRMRRVHSDLLA